MNPEPVSGEVVDPRAAAAAIVRRAFTGRVVDYAGGRDPDQWLSQAAEDLRLAGRNPNTDATYRRVWKIIVQFCAESKRQHMPMTEETVQEFIESCWRRRGRYGRPWAPAYVRLCVDVIAVAHQRAVRPERDQSGRLLRGYVPPTKSKAVLETLAGYTRRWLEAGHRPDKAYPISMTELEAMVDTCDVRSPYGLLHALVLAFTYDGGFRRSEVVARNWVDLELRVADEANVSVDDHVVVHVPYSKTDQAGDGDMVVLYAHGDDAAASCPVRLLLAWRALFRALNIPLVGPVFRSVLSPGSPPRDGGPRKATVTDTRLPADALERIVTRAADAAGIAAAPDGERRRHISPHGLRAGAVTAASEDDTVSPAAIFEHFRFSKDSPVALRYMRHGRKRSQNPMRRVWVRRRDGGASPGGGHGTLPAARGPTPGAA